MPTRSESSKENQDYTGHIRWALKTLAEEREEILAAFMAKYRCGPEEVEQVVHYEFGKVTWYVRKK
jgi:hypothetical protein